MAKIFSVFWAVFGCLFVIEALKSNGVERVFYWKEVMFENLPLKDNTLIGPYKYRIPTNNNVMGVNHHVASGLMVTTVARVRPGVPSTLNAFCLADYKQGTSPHLWGFPNYERNTLKASFYNEGRKLSRHEKNKYSNYYHFYGGYNRENDYTIINIYYPHIDERCNRLFVLDTGYLHYSPTVNYDVQYPALLVYDLPSDGCQTRNFRLIRRVEFPKYLWTNSVSFHSVTVDYQSKGSCDDIFLYITNVFDNSLIVYDYKRGDFWSFVDESMKPIPSETSFVFEGDLFTLPLGIVNVVLGYPDKDGDRNAYFAPSGSSVEYVVTTKLLKSRKASYKYNPEDFKLINYRGCGSQVYKQVFDPATGVIFIGEVNSHRIRCWNTQLPLNPDTMGTVFESDSLLYPADMYLDSQGYLWFLGNHLPTMYLTEDPLDLSKINSNLFRVKASEAIKGTICDTYFY